MFLHFELIELKCVVLFLLFFYLVVCFGSIFLHFSSIERKFDMLLLLFFYLIGLCFNASAFCLN